MDAPRTDYDLLVGISQQLCLENQTDSLDWNGSPFQWIKSKPSRTIGAIGEKMVSRWLEARGFSIGRSRSSDADRIVNGIPVEIKFSTLWATGTYTFQQLRDQRYEFAILLGIAPKDVHCWMLPKNVIMKRWRNNIPSSNGFEPAALGDIVPQHNAGHGGHDTAWLTFNPYNPPEWLRPFGGTAAEALDAIRSALGNGRKTS